LVKVTIFSRFVVKCTGLVGLRFFAMSVLFYFDCRAETNFVALLKTAASAGGVKPPIAGVDRDTGTS
jgi:hypothetical protein